MPVETKMVGLVQLSGEFPRGAVNEITARHGVPSIQGHLALVEPFGAPSVVIAEMLALRYRPPGVLVDRRGEDSSLPCFRLATEADHVKARVVPRPQLAVCLKAKLGNLNVGEFINLGDFAAQQLVKFNLARYLKGVPEKKPQPYGPNETIPPHDELALGLVRSEIRRRRELEGLTDDWG